MLVSKKYKPNDIVCFKLVNGDEIVAKVVEQTDTGFELSHPCTVVPSQQGIGLIQSLFSADINNNVTLNNSHIMMHSPIIDKLENHYIQTTTGIQPVTRGGIIT
jgi:hypothetical protein